MIQLEHVTKEYERAGARPVRALDELSLEVQAGETFCLIGASGCGKTTALRLMNRLIEPTRGAVRVGGEDVRGLDAVRLRRRMGYVVQSGGLFPHLTIGANVALLCELEGWSAERRARRVEELLELVHLPAREFARRHPRELSGGQRQRVGVARALALDPPILLMDEPFGALDPITRHELQEEFLELDRLVAKTVVIVTHDLDEAFRLGDRVGLMSAGRLEMVGTPEDFRERPRSEYAARFVARHFGATA